MNASASAQMAICLTTCKERSSVAIIGQEDMDSQPEHNQDHQVTTGLVEIGTGVWSWLT